MNSNGEVISGTLAVAIIAGIAILLTGIFIGTFSTSLTEQGKDKALACKASVLKASQFTRLVDQEKFYASCESIPWEVPKLGDDAEENKRSMGTFIVKQYEQCWDKFHQGKLAPVAGDVSDIDVRCFICSQFTMPDDAPVIADVDEGIAWRLSIDEKADAFLDDAFFESEDGQMYYGVRDIQLVNGFWKVVKYLTDWDPIQYDSLIKSVQPWDIRLEPGKTYYIYNAELVEQKGFILKALDTHAKIMVGEPSFEPAICDYLHN